MLCTLFGVSWVVYRGSSLLSLRCGPHPQSYICSECCSGGKPIPALCMKLYRALCTHPIILSTRLGRLLVPFSKSRYDSTRIGPQPANLSSAYSTPIGQLISYILDQGSPTWRRRAPGSPHGPSGSPTCLF